MADAISYNLRDQDETMSPTARFVSEIEEGLCDWKFRIYQDVDCNGDSIAGLTLYFDAYFNPMDYDEDRDEEKNNFGQISVISKTYTRVPNFDVIVDQLRNEYLYRLASTPNLMLHVKDDDKHYKITDLSIDRKAIIKSYLLELQVRLQFESDDFVDLGYISCCRPVFTDAPFVDDCPELPGGTGDCGDFAVSVSIAETTLTATPADAPGSVTINWLFRALSTDPWTVLINDASSVSLGAFGQYKAVAISDGCSVDDTYLYQDPCASITVEIADNGVGLVAVGSGCDTPNYTWFLWDDEAEEWEEVYDGGPSYIPPGAGIYKVEYGGCAECVAIDIVEWSGSSSCELTVSIVELDGGLVAGYSACEGGAPVFQWFRDTGSGPELIGSLGTLPIPGPGLFELYITCTDSDCSGYARKVITCDDPCLLTLDVAVVADVATATVDGCEDDATFTWFRNQGSGYQEAGTGNPFDLPGVGLYKLTVECGGCTKSMEFFHCPGTNDCQKSQYFSNFVGTILTITAFTVPNPDDVTEKFIRDNLWIFRQAQKVSYNIGFTITFVDNQLVLSWEAESEFIEVYWLGDCT